MAEFAVNASVPRLRRSTSQYSFDPPNWNGYALEQDRSRAPAELSLSYDQWGQFSLRFTAPPTSAR